MAFVDTFKKGQAYRIHTGVDGYGNDLYDVISFKTSSDDVIFEDEDLTLSEKIDQVQENLLDYATGYLLNGETEVTVTGNNITANGMLDVYVPTEWCKLTPEKYVSQMDGSVTLEFPLERVDVDGNEQTEPIEVRVICKN